MNCSLCQNISYFFISGLRFIHACLKTKLKCRSSAEYQYTCLNYETKMPRIEKHRKSLCDFYLFDVVCDKELLFGAKVKR